MSTQSTRLANGLRVVSHHMPHLETVSLGVWVAAGARHEREGEHGISHLLEHMAFKGTERRSATDIAEEIEAVGGELNAATSLETTAYFARILKADVGIALDILADILQIPRYAQDELEREREVILQEIAATRDSPDEIAYELLQDAAFPNQAIGRPDPRHHAERHQLRRRRPAHVPRGQLRRQPHGRVGRRQRRSRRHRCATLRPNSPASMAAWGADSSLRAMSGGTRTSAKPFEQSHLVMAFAGPSYRAEEFYTAQVFSGLFGGGMSSRLFQEVRERRGLCYAIYSSCWALADTGLFGIHAATGPEMMGKLIDVVGEQLVGAAAEKPAEAELARAKAQLKAGLLMGLESSSARAEQMARQLLLFDRLIEPPELIERIDAVTAEAVRELAAKLVSGAPPSVAVVGAGRKGEAFARTAAERVTHA